MAAEMSASKTTVMTPATTPVPHEDKNAVPYEDMFYGLAVSGKKRSGVKHSPELWDKRAESWEEDLREPGGKRAQRSDIRIATTRDYLKQHGALAATSDVIDIGCGLGRFTVEFAKCAQSALGIDYSEQMTTYGQAFALEQQVGNASFQTVDFTCADIDELGWRKRFDLVFSSITPAVSKPQAWQRMMDMSRKWCFNSVYVKSAVPLEDKIVKELWDKPSASSWNGSQFWAMFNLLWLWGYFPQVSYFTEIAEERRAPSLQMARNLVERHAPAVNEAEVERTLRLLESYAEEDGMFDFTGEWVYAWVLWDITQRANHTLS